MNGTFGKTASIFKEYGEKDQEKEKL